MMRLRQLVQSCYFDILADGTHNLVHINATVYYIKQHNTHGCKHTSTVVNYYICKNNNELTLTLATH